MKHLVTLIIISLLIVTCEENITVTMSRQPGKITGKVQPAHVSSTVSLYQGDLIDQTTTSGGIFVFGNVTPGVYRLTVAAENFASQELSGIRVEDGEGHDTGVIQLSKYPYPLSFTYPLDGEIETGRSDIEIYFDENMNNTSVLAAIAITPEAVIQSYTSYLYYSSEYHLFRIWLDLAFDTQYTVTIDSAAETVNGLKMEFPYSFAFKTERFKVTSFRTREYYLDGDWPVTLRFNGTVDTQVKEHISIDPALPFWLSSSSSSNEITIYPSTVWMPDTVISVQLAKSLPEAGGTTLGHDTTLTFNMPALRVVQTIPNRGQFYVDRYERINIRFNNVIDEGTIESGLKISPPLAFYEMSTSSYGGSTEIRINPNVLEAATEYTVSLNDSLKDVFGRDYKEGYRFTFTTK